MVFRLFVFLMCILGSLYCSADEFRLGFKTITIPTPEDFVRVTPEMEFPYRYVNSFVNAENDLLAYYITHSDSEFARNGKAMTFERAFTVQIYKKFRNRKIGTGDFAAIVSDMKYNNEHIFEEAKLKIADNMKRSSASLSDEFSIDFELNASDVVPLDVHYETDQATSYTILFNNQTEVDGRQETIPSATTVTIVNLGGRVVYLYCSAPKDELEWTRSASQVWVEAAINENDAPPVISAKKAETNRLLMAMVYGSLKGMALVLLIVIPSSWLKKRKAKNAEHDEEGSSNN